MQKVNPKVIFWIGFLIFLIGDYAPFFGIEKLRFLQLAGLLLASFAVVKWLLLGKLKDKFRKDKNEDNLTYFLNKFLFRWMQIVVLIWMLFSSFFTILRLLSTQ